METELEALSAKLDRVVLLVEHLRSENHTLRQRVEAMEAEREMLLGNMEQARSRVEALMHQLPEEASK